MATELTTFSGSQFVGKPVLADVEFLSGLQSINDLAAAQGLQVHVTSSARRHGVAVGNTIVPPASRSNHLVGHAIDMNLKKDGKFFNSKALRKQGLKKQPKAIRAFIEGVRADPALRWGGDFNTEDPVHIDDALNVHDPLLWEKKFPIIQGELASLMRPSAERGHPRLLMLERPFMQGADVRALQDKLVALGYEMNPDGVFGNLTDRAVTDFQREKGMEADGIVGAGTRRALGL